MVSLRCNKCRHTWQSMGRPGNAVACPKCGQRKKIPRSSGARNGGGIAANQRAPEPATGRPAPRWAEATAPDDDEDQGAELGEDADDKEPVASAADALLYVLSRSAWVAPKARPPKVREIVVQPGQIHPPARGQGAQRPAGRPQAGRAGGELAEIQGVNLTAHTPRSGEWCEICPDRTGRIRCAQAMYRIVVLDPDDLPRSALACHACAVLLDDLSRVVEQPALLATHPR